MDIVHSRGADCSDVRFAEQVCRKGLQNRQNLQEVWWEWAKLADISLYGYCGRLQSVTKSLYNQAEPSGHQVHPVQTTTCFTIHT